MKNLKNTALYLSLLVPSISSAFSLNAAGVNFKSIIGEVLSIIGLVVPLLFGAAFIVFFWGLSKFILHSGSQAELEKGKNYMIWGVIALFVLVSYRAIVGFIASDLEIGNSQIEPTLKTDAKAYDTSVGFSPKL